MPKPKVKYDAELAKMQKKANERMRSFEKSGVSSIAYEVAQARLEQMGKRSSDSRGRRFSETGKGTAAEISRQKAILNKFLNSKVGTVREQKAATNKAWKTANRGGRLSKVGVTKEQYLKFWQSQQENEKARMLGSDTEELILMTMSRIMKKDEREAKRRGETYEQEYTTEEISEIIKSSESYKEALHRLGITIQDIEVTRNLGAL